MRRTYSVPVPVTSFMACLLCCVCHAQTTITEPVPAYADVHLEGTDKGVRIDVAGFGHIGSPGDPVLPSKTFFIALPPDANMSTVSVVIRDAQSETLTLESEVVPAPPAVAYAKGRLVEAWGEHTEIVNGHNVSIYGEDAFFPASHIEIAHVGKMREWKIVALTYYPFRYNPVTKQLAQSQGGQASLSYATDGAPGVLIPGKPIWSLTVSSETGTPVWSLLENLKKHIVNLDAANTWYRQGDLSGAGNAVGIRSCDQATPSPGYFILTTQTIAAHSQRLLDFVAHKQALGFNVQVVTEPAWGGGTGDVAANRIRQYLQNNYLSQAIEYALLVGNPNPENGDVPMKMLWPRSQAADEFKQAPSDFFYADLTGDWDLNGNGRYGEYPGDFDQSRGVDVFPEVLVGRIPCYGDISALDAVLRKMIRYESGEYAGPWTARVLLSMKDGDNRTQGYHLGELIKDTVQSLGFYATRIYEEEYAVNPSPDMTPCSYGNVFDAWKRCAGIHVWWTHGAPTEAVDIIRNWECEHLPDDQPSFVFSVSCENGHPEEENNLGYSLLHKGSIANVTATRISYYERRGQDTFNQLYAPDMAYQYVREMTHNQVPFGDALFRVKAAFQKNDEQWMNQCVFNLYGDPAMSYSLPGAVVKILSPKDETRGDVRTSLIYTNTIDGPVRIFDNEVLLCEGNQCRGEHMYGLDDLQKGDHRLRVELSSGNVTVTDEIAYRAGLVAEGYIEGAVFLRKGVGLEGVTIRVLDASSKEERARVVTDASGRYRTFTLLQSSYTVVPEYPPGNYLFTPATRTIDVRLFPVEIADFDVATPVTWTDMVKVKVEGNKVVKTSSTQHDDAGAASWDVIEKDGALVFDVIETNTERACGLSASNDDLSPFTTDYGIWLLGDTCAYVVENGVLAGGATAYKSGDTYSVEREETTVSYRKNGRIIYVSRVASSGTLLARATFYDPQSTIANARIVGAAAPPNSQPVAIDQVVWTGRNMAKEITLTATDKDPAPLAYHIVSSPSAGGLSGIPPLVRYTPNTDFVGTDRFTFLANDGQSDSNIAAVNITVLEVDPVTWTDLIGVTTNGNSLRKTAGTGWGNAGAASTAAIAGDGALFFQADETNLARMCGLSEINRDANFNTIEYAIYLRHNGVVYVYESGNAKGSYGPYASGDIFAVERTGSAVAYKKNGNTFYASNMPNSGSLIADCSLYDQGATLHNAGMVRVAPENNLVVVEE